MAKIKQPTNPFYVLCVIAGVIFTLTACAYGVLLLRTRDGLVVPGEDHPLMNLLDQHGIAILVLEVALLAFVSIAAITLDHYRGKRIAQKQTTRDPQS